MTNQRGPVRSPERKTGEVPKTLTHKLFLTTTGLGECTKRVDRAVARHNATRCRRFQFATGSKGEVLVVGTAL